MQLYKAFNPAVSIILPTYNRANLLTRAIDSVIMQKYRKWELIIVDDGSRDSTMSLVKKYVGAHNNIRYIFHSNRNLPISLNIGIQASGGKYITFLGSDDEYKTGHLDLRISTMEKDQTIDILHGGVEIIGSPFVKDKRDISKKIHLSECIIGGTIFGKRKVFFDMQGFNDLKYSEDSDFIERASKKFKIIKIDNPTYIYHRDTPGSICNTI